MKSNKEEAVKKVCPHCGCINFFDRQETLLLPGIKCIKCGELLNEPESDEIENTKTIKN